MRPTALLTLSILAACHPLGPVPVATGVSPVPRARFDGELQLGVMPGFYLGNATQSSPKGSPFAQLSLLIEPGAAVPGLLVGGRVFGPSYDGVTDPMIGYRTTVGPEKRMAIAVIGFGAHQSGRYNGASYSATRVGGELAGDLRVGPQRPWLEPHLELALDVTGISAKGDYCEDSGGAGTDCPAPPALAVLHHADASGAYPAVTAGASLFVGHHHASWIHGARALLMISAGLMPRVADGVQQSAQPFFSGGLALSISFGAAR